MHSAHWQTALASDGAAHTQFLHTLAAVGFFFVERPCNGCRWTKRLHIIRCEATCSGWLVVFVTNNATRVHIACYQLHLDAGNFPFVVFIIIIFLIIEFYNFFLFTLFPFWGDVKPARIHCSAVCPEYTRFFRFALTMHCFCVEMVYLAANASFMLLILLRLPDDSQSFRLYLCDIQHNKYLYNNMMAAIINSDIVYSLLCSLIQMYECTLHSCVHCVWMTFDLVQATAQNRIQQRINWIHLLLPPHSSSPSLSLFDTRSSKISSLQRSSAMLRPFIDV